MFEEYFEHGPLKLKVTYRFDQLNGDFEEYFENGDLKAKGTFKDDKKNGDFEEYFENGQLESKVTYKDNQLNGDLEHYFRNGQLKLKGLLKDNKMHGTFQRYNHEGKKVEVDMYPEYSLLYKELDKWGNENRTLHKYSAIINPHNMPKPQRKEKPLEVKDSDKGGGNIKKKQYSGPVKTTLIRPGKVNESVEEKKSDHPKPDHFDSSSGKSIINKDKFSTTESHPTQPITFKKPAEKNPDNAEPYYFDSSSGKWMKTEDDFYAGRTYIAKPMSFSDAVKACMTKFATFSGRASRSEFWWFYLLCLVCSSPVSIGNYLVQYGLIYPNSIFWIAFFSSFIIGITLFLPMLAVACRRLHDIGRSGWWLLICLIPIIGGLITLWWGITESEPRKNKYDQ